MAPSILRQTMLDNTLTEITPDQARMEIFDIPRPHKAFSGLNSVTAWRAPGTLTLWEGTVLASSFTCSCECGSIHRAGDRNESEEPSGDAASSWLRRSRVRSILVARYWARPSLSPKTLTGILCSTLRIFPCLATTIRQNRASL